MNTLLNLSVLLPPLLFVGMSYIIAKKWHYDSYASLCAHGAQNTVALKVFRVSTATLAIWYYMSWYFYISNVLVIPFFVALFATAAIAIITIVVAPAANANRTLIGVHNVASIGLGCIIFILALEIALYNSLPLAVEIFMFASLLIGAVASVDYALFAWVRRYTFFLESLGIGLFSIGVFLAVLFVGE